MKRNKANVVSVTDELTPLTRRILAQMGPEGQDIQNRLEKFLHKLTSTHLTIIEKANRFSSGQE